MNKQLKGATRLSQIGSYNCWPCGGTHVKSLVELGQVVATKQKLGSNTVRISYGMAT